MCLNLLDFTYEIDHIVPCHAFKGELNIEANQRILCWFRNLQPLWSDENRTKGGKYNERISKKGNRYRQYY